MVFLWFSYGFPEGILQVLLGILGEAKLVGHVHLLPTRKLGAGTPGQVGKPAKNGWWFNGGFSWWFNGGLMVV